MIQLGGRLFYSSHGLWYPYNTSKQAILHSWDICLHVIHDICKDMASSCYAIHAAPVAFWYIPKWDLLKNRNSVDCKTAGTVTRKQRRVKTHWEKTRMNTAYWGTFEKNVKGQQRWVMYRRFSCHKKVWCVDGKNKSKICEVKLL